jgi:hypothetical protein
MRKLLLLLVLFMALDGFAQTGDSTNKKEEKQKWISGDSNSINPGMINDSLLNMIPARDSVAMKEDMDRNINNLVELQTNLHAREKRNAMIRISIGVALLIVLVIGLRRKTGKNNKSV